MKTFKKLLALTLIFVLVASCFAGCKDDKKKVGKGEYDAFIYMSPNPYNPEMPIWKEAESKTGVRLNGVVSEVASDVASSYQTMLAGSKLPEVIRYNYTELQKLARDGAVVPLNDLIDEYAPNIKAFFEKYEDAKAVATAEDGNIYILPSMSSELEAAPSMGFFIRQDWLDKLGLEVPTNVEEFEEVLRAFKNEDPNGNGKKDEIPYFGRSGTLEQLLQLFNANMYLIMDGDKVVYSPTTKDFKKGIKTVARWYQEGLIDPEIFTRQNAREQLLGGNTGGVTCDWFSSTGAFNDTYKESIPGFNFVPMLPPKNTKGKVQSLESAYTINTDAWCITASADEEAQIELIKYFDFWYSEEGQELAAYGVEGESYEIDKNGNKKWTKKALEYPGGQPEFMRSIGGGELPTIGSSEALKSAMHKVSLKGYEMYESIVVKRPPKFAHTDKENEIIAAKFSNVQTALEEQVQKWLIGRGDVDKDWDSYVETLNSMGAKELTKIYNAAYKRMYK